MAFSRKGIFTIILLTHILFPILLILGLFFVEEVNLLTYISLCLADLTTILLYYIVGAWEFTYYNLRYIYLVGIVLALVIHGISIKYTELFKTSDIVLTIISVGVIIGCGIQIYKALLAAKKSEKELLLSFPFKNGRYLITDGGDGAVSSLMNYHYKAGVHSNHNTHFSMRYAVDIVKLNGLSSTVPILLTNENKKYAIFNEPVYSPCDGEVIQVVDGVENNEPFSQNFPYNVGNCVVIKNGNYYVVMGHFQKGSIKVAEGTHVNVGDKIALVGNSGLTPRPHLHMQVSEGKDGDFWSGNGVPVYFTQGLRPTKNATIKI